MLKNYFKIAFRNLLRNKVFSFINIAGLSLGLACCLLILLYTKDELTFDRFQQKNDRLYRITCQVIDKEAGRDETFGEAAAVQGPSFKAGIPEVEDFIRTYEQDFIVKHGTESLNQKIMWVDEHFFQVFSFPLLSGTPEHILSDPHSIVLTEEMAKKYFGSTDAVGKILELEIDSRFEPFTVSGIAKRAPENSSIKFDMLLPFKYYAALSKNDNGDWTLLNYPTFLLLHPGADLQAVTTKMNRIYAINDKEKLDEISGKESPVKFSWGLQPFLKMHLDSGVINEGGIKDESKPIYSYVLGGIAFFILLIACINFINLTIAQSMKRSREIGLRKVIGGSRTQLLRQFLGESFILCFIALTGAMLLVNLVLPLFNELANKKLSLEYLLDLPLILSFAGLFLATGFAAGFYPAVVLSRFRPVETLYNRMRLGGKNYLSKILVVFQFALTTFLIIVTLFIFSQYNLLTHSDLGYNDKDLLAVNFSGQEGNRTLLDLFKTEVSQLAGVREVGEGMNGRWGTGAKAAGRDIGIDYQRIDEKYLSTLGIPLVKGRNFSKDFPSDSSQSVLVNQAFVKEAGWRDPIGQTVDLINGKECKLTVIGVVKDYHFASLKQKIGAQVFTTNPKIELGRFFIRIDRGSTAATLRSIEKIYRKLYSWHPFEYYFVEEKNRKSYEAESKWKQIISYSAGLTVFISSIGLFGLTMLSIRKRTREIGVRKVLGASEWQISALLARNFISLVLLAFLLAIPVAWYATSRWLENFPYRIRMNMWIVVAAAVFTLLIALLTVSFQSIKAALANPVKSLRTE